MDNRNTIGGGAVSPTKNEELMHRVVGVPLTQLLNAMEGDMSALTTDTARRLYEECRPKYDHKEVSERIERNVLYKQVQPHLVDVTLDIPDPIPILSRYGSIIASEGNISAVVGAAKSKKTFLCSALVGAMLHRGDSHEPPFGITPKQVDVLWVDTEQSQNHVQRVAKRILHLAERDEQGENNDLRVLTLREIEPKRRMEIVEDSIKLFRPKLVVVDGISDLMYNSNCIEESDAVVGRMMALSTEFKCHIMNVLHTNPNSDKARGHIGSTLQRKVETMIYVHKSGNCSIAEAQFCRNEEFAPFAFHITEEGLPEECDMPQDSAADDVCVEVLRTHFPNGIERKVLTSKIVELHSISRPLARVKITRAITRGQLIADGETLRLP